MTVGSALMAWRFGWTTRLPPFLLFATVSGVLFVTDAVDRRIPSKVVLPAYPIAAVLLVVACAPDGPWRPLLRALCGLVVVFGCYLLLGLTFRGQLGLGDVWLGGLLGGFLGFLGWPVLFAGTLLGWLLGATYVLFARGMPQRSTVIPLGPFLILGALIAIVVSQ